MWGIIPAAGQGSRIQPLAFSKELLPVGSRLDGDIERPRAVSEYLVDRMVRAGAEKICFVISPGKSDILHYYGGAIGKVVITYAVQTQPRGLCDAIFRALPLIPPDETVIVGLPDTIWFPEDALGALPDDRLSFLLFPVDRPELFDSVIIDSTGAVREIQVKSADAASPWVWGAFKLPGRVLRELHQLWQDREPRDEYIGTLVNAFIAAGGCAHAVTAGSSYVDVGTVNGYRQAMALLRDHAAPSSGAAVRPAGIRRSPISADKTERRNPMAGPGRDEIERTVAALGPWFHNLELGGVRTAPDHFLGNYPAVKWQRFDRALPTDLTGKTVLDIGCNAGFYSIEMKRRGAARVLGIDSDERYLAQARFAAQVTGVEVEFQRLSVYDIASLGERFDLVLFIGVLYHLRHPLLALDLIHDHVADDLLVFQAMQRGDNAVEALEPDYDFWDQEVFDRPGYPRLHFIERFYAGDPTNWWIPNRACTEAMLRSAGFAILDHPEQEVFICRSVERPQPDGPVYPARKRRP